MAASAGTVTLELDANSVRLLRELQKAQRATKRTSTQMRRDMQRAGAMMAKAMVGVGVAIVAASKASITFADRIGKTADKLGVGVEALQEFRFAASQAGIAQNTLDMALQRFTRRAAEAAHGTGEAEKTLKDLGIQLVDTNGQMRKAEDLLGDVADAWAKGVDPATRLAQAQKLFDSEGVVMVNMLRDGSEGLKAMRQAARDAGVVLREDLVRNAEEAANEMDKLQKVLQVKVAETVLENKDAILELVGALLKLVDIAGKAAEKWRELAEDFAAFTGGTAIDDWDRRAGEILELERQLTEARERSVNFLGRENRMWKARAASLEEEIKLKRELLTKDLQALAPMQAPPVVPAAEPPPQYNPIVTPEEVDKDAQKIADIIRELQAEVATFGMGDERVMIQLLDLNATREQKNAAADLLGQIRALEMEEENREESVKRRQELEQEYQQLVAQTMTDIERHAEVIDRINTLYQEGIIPSVEEYAEVVKRVNDEFQERQEKSNDELDEFGKQAARNMQDALAEFLFNPFDDGLEGMVKGFANAIRKMVAEAAAAALLKKLFGDESGGAGIFGSGGLGGFIGSIFGKAKGGPVRAGVPYLVGEEGPEIIVPQAAGMVIPNDYLGQSQNVINTNVYLPPQAQPRTAAQTAYEVANRQSRALARNR